MKLNRPFASPICHVVFVPKCIASYVQCSLGWIWEVYAHCGTKLFRHKWKAISTHILSRLAQTEINSIPTEVARRNIPVKVFMFKSHIIAIDRKNVIPEGEKLCLTGGLGTFSASWIPWTSSLKPARFKRKSDQPHSGTNCAASLVNSKCGNSIMI